MPRAKSPLIMAIDVACTSKAILQHVQKVDTESLSGGGPCLFYRNRQYTKKRSNMQVWNQNKGCCVELQLILPKQLCSKLQIEESLLFRIFISVKISISKLFF